MDEMIFTVNLVKRKLGGFGFLVKPRSSNPPAVISHIVKGGVAEENGLLKPGDIIFKVNGTSLTESTYQHAVDLLTKLPVGKSASITVKDPDSIRSTLETTFSTSSNTKTIRITDSRSKKLEAEIQETEFEENVKNSTSNIIYTQAQINGTLPVNGNAKTILIDKNGVDHEADRSKGTGLQNENSNKKDQPESLADLLIRQNGDIKSKSTIDSFDTTGHPNSGLEAIKAGLEQKGKPPSPEKSPTLASLVKKKTKYVRLRNLINGTQLVDTLHQQALKTHCTSARCMGSMMKPYGGDAPENRTYGTPRPKDEVKLEAIEFLTQYYTSIKRNNTPAHEQRLHTVINEIDETGTYELDEKELIYGAKLAWRNASRCIGRIQWNKLQVFDARDVTTAHGMFEACLKQIKYGTNKGKIRSAITIFPQRKEVMKDYRVWNGQLISYAGYKQDGTIIGDPGNVEFTELCQALGWKGKGGMFDILPLVLQANGNDPEWFEIPEELVLQVKIKHPNYPWFEDLGLQWYALPAVSGMTFDVGGVEFTAAPFNGWYMVTEISVRDLGDTSRYNKTEIVAKNLGLDTRTHASMWKDRALVELTVAVLHSFNEAGVTLMDHHTTSESFMKHLENEQKLRGGCPADWVWIIPPLSGSACPVFHQEMLNYKLKPAYEYAEDPWKYHPVVKKPISAKKKFGFKEVAKAVKFSAKLMGQAMAKRHKATILYATETGKSEGYAKMLGDLFSHAFDPKVMCMEDYNFPELEHEQLVMIVTSTFGNGEAPGNGEAFGDMLYRMRHPPDSNLTQKRLSSIHIQQTNVMKAAKKKDDTQPLANLRYSVFGLGSRAYPHFCAFAHSVNNLIKELGGEEIYKIGEGDELCGQEESYRNWAKAVFKDACETFCIEEDLSVKAASESLAASSTSWSPGRFRYVAESSGKTKDICEGLSKVHNKKVIPVKVISKKNLQSKESNRQTVLVRLDTNGQDALKYQPGDHLAIFPANQPSLVDTLIEQLREAPPPDETIRLEICKEISGPFGLTKRWETLERFPVPCTLREAFSRYLDITSPATPQMLMDFATQATKQTDRERLEELGKGSSKYEDWKYDRFPNIVEVLEEFPSIQVSAVLLLTQLPLLQTRYYSISSSPLMHPGEVHVTVAVVTYRTKGGLGPVHHGVCSTWLNNAKEGDVVPCFVRGAPSFHLPEDNTQPIIMIGPGTGIAPFRSFWQQRLFQRKYHKPPVPKEEEEDDAFDTFFRSRQGLAYSPQTFRKPSVILDPESSTKAASSSRKLTPTSSPMPRRRLPSCIREFEDEDQIDGGKGDLDSWGDMILYFGCRNSKLDDIYKDETSEAMNDGGITQVYTAVSRDENQPKMYVQDLIKEHSDYVCETLLLDRGHIYVCGDVSMASDVCKMIQNLLQEYAALSQQEAQECIDKLRSSGRYHEDIFGVTLRTAEVTDRVRSAARKAWVYISGATKKLRAAQPRTERALPLLGKSSPPNKSAKRPRKPERTTTVTVLMRPEEAMEAKGKEMEIEENKTPKEETEDENKKPISKKTSLPVVTAEALSETK